MQASSLDKLLAGSDLALDATILFDADVDLLVARLLRRATQLQRPDDTSDVIAHRVSLFQREIAGLAGHYEGRGLLLRIDASQGRETVSRDVISRLQTLTGLG